MPNGSVLADGREIVYACRFSRRARRPGLAVSPPDSVVVTLPFGCHEREAERLVSEHSAWVIRQLARLDKFRDHVFLPRSRCEYLKRKEAARTLVAESLGRHAAALGLSCARVSIRNARRTWGSCSADGGLNFNYKLVFLPPRLADYVVLHELCHRKVFNHSEDFWRAVASVMPDYMDRRRELRRYHL